MVKPEMICKDTNVFHATKHSKIIITRPEIFTIRSGMNMYMIDVPYISYLSAIKKAEIGLLTN
jgi:hypothetical protein